MSTTTYELSETLLFTERFGNEWGQRLTDLIRKRAQGNTITDELLKSCLKEVCAGMDCGSSEDPSYDPKVMSDSLSDFAHRRFRNAREILSDVQRRNTAVR